MKTIHTLKDLITDVESFGKMKLLVSDVDYTLLDFDIIHGLGIQGISSEIGDEVATKVNDMFFLMLEGHRKKLDEEWEERPQFNKLLEDLKHIQPKNQHNVRPWSREALILLAAKELEAVLDQLEIERARESYWMSSSKHDLFYDDAKQVLEYLRSKDIPLILFTGSDSLMQVGDEGLEYDSVFSEQYKRNRLESLPFNTQHIVIGDPIDKPHQAYFDRVFAVIDEHFSDIPKESIFFIGDSPRNDLEVPEKHGYPTIHIDRKKDLS